MTGISEVAIAAWRRVRHLRDWNDAQLVALLVATIGADRAEVWRVPDGATFTADLSHDARRARQQTRAREGRVLTRWAVIVECDPALASVRCHGDGWQAEQEARYVEAAGAERVHAWREAADDASDWWSLARVLTAARKGAPARTLEELEIAATLEDIEHEHAMAKLRALGEERAA